MGQGLGIVDWDRGLGLKIRDWRQDWGQGYDWELGLGLEIRIGVSDEIGDWDQDLGLGIGDQDSGQGLEIWYLGLLLEIRDGGMEIVIGDLD